MTVPPLKMQWTPGDDPSPLIEREWLATNGLGGYASGSVLGIPTRRYHGMLVANLSDPKGRHVMLSRVDEIVMRGPAQINLSGTEFADGRLASQANLYLTEFRLDGMTPTWVFVIGDSVLEKSVVMPHGENTVFILYRLLSGPALDLCIRPFVECRRLDSTLASVEGFPIQLYSAPGGEEFEVAGTGVMTRVRALPGGSPFTSERQTDQGVLYRVEQEREHDCTQNVFSPGYYRLTLDEQSPDGALIASTEPWASMNITPAAIADAERNRLANLISAVRAPGFDATTDPFAARLVMAADQFIVVPGSRKEESVLAAASGNVFRSVMAGYHWFNDWGRDTMISLEGLTLCTGRIAEARAIVQTFAHYIEDGLVPNLFPEGARQALYNTVDATLWFFHALDRYLEYSGDEQLLIDIFPKLQSVIGHHVRGTRFGIGVDAADGLISAAAEGYQLTWMDAKVDGWVVTPRRGKPVEIQGLWYNALELMAGWAVRVGQPMGTYRELSERVRASFNRRYWRDEQHSLFDVIDGPDGDDPSLRPNQVFTLSLRHPVLAKDRWAPMMDTVSRSLLTPYGLRTLSPDSPDYQRTYQGSLRSRDAAYHQGTVWPWLIGHFINAWQRAYPDQPQPRHLLAAFPDHLLAGGIGSISEIFDAETPHVPRGCIAQAWSVAEVLRVWLATRAR